MKFVQLVDILILIKYRLKPINLNHLFQERASLHWNEPTEHITFLASQLFCVILIGSKISKCFVFNISLDMTYEKIYIYQRYYTPSFFSFLKKNRNFKNLLGVSF